ncbi:isoprenylcysteine carboxylmethyltransferase family protein [Idiomarina sp. M1R2S28]|uniref:Isoprenylcysteine carboxylmethyltransferase family protein n=1 Tax=Idiomarina rhizosphaerae TaxID=2961572 RepID=A0A9X2G0D5_9GAMM|nr:isoprenylcysteine carboxylmethyltransferase family protein [Idiomarina rhizosphaerae]MCP1338901.1 isoprenylcysteine carboxylmethyltransferase family protein [Idiomarina rhizosphaerae]
MFDIDLISRHFLALYFLFIAVHYASTAIGLSSRTAQSHIQYGKKGSVTWWVRQVFNLFRGAILIVCIARVFFPIDPWLGVITPLYNPWLLSIGMVTMLASLGLVSYNHAYMRQDWRSGIDNDKNRNLLTRGPFSRSRNPMFLAIMLGQLGLFLALPSLFTLVCLATGVAMIRLQASKEEQALQELYGDEYLQYQSQVPRWFKWMHTR